MRSPGPILLLLAVALASCGVDQGAQGVVMFDGTNDARERAIPTAVDILRFDGSQRTCALFVALHAAALEDPAVFGGDAVEVHWNTCPSGTMVACASVSTADGDTLQVGIPWTLRIGTEL